MSNCARAWNGIHCAKYHVPYRLLFVFAMRYILFYVNGICFTWCESKAGLIFSKAVLPIIVTGCQTATRGSRSCNFLSTLLFSGYPVGGTSLAAVCPDHGEFRWKLFILIRR